MPRAVCLYRSTTLRTTALGRMSSVPSNSSNTYPTLRTPLFYYCSAKMIGLPPNQSVLAHVNEAASFLRQRLPAELQKPQVAIICGSGLGGLADAVHDQPRAEYNYASIPHFPHPTGKLRSPVPLCRTDSHTQSRRTCGEVGLWTAGQENTGCSNGWPYAVSLLDEDIHIEH